MHDIFDILSVIIYFFLDETLIKENNLCQVFQC